ncbi:acidic phospholipase A2 Cc1-PLA2-like [Mytilus californianus]|uniref:acidic phospholipase A2 Cc1-PLA2-like n=1 Tax=Mytilus californianus TaxID=6549 RepID=UPI002246892B|nr:acidic phospholipase A2 Cc1-PLA2-like [Mytilus californianus]
MGCSALKLNLPVIVTICLISVIYGGRVKRNVVEFGDMVGAVTGRDPSDFYGYGHYCGVGGRGVVLDPIDSCCAQHDDCYGDQKVAHCGIYLPKYSWFLSDMGITCSDAPEDFCRRHLCECDRRCAECFAENNEFYEPSLLRSIHKIANRLFHILDPALHFFTHK